ncbi:MAG: PQQ-binding-like beta-propeller repeat protein [Planctomycetota bacterium]|nr:PQQ-binding-like beta-propeller repeat protein [Planctomycetota bacterium]
MVRVTRGVQTLLTVGLLVAWGATALAQPTQSAKPGTRRTDATRTQDRSREWSTFRGPGGLGVADNAKPPVEWGSETGVVWKAALPGAGASSPVVRNQRAYLTSYTGFFVPGEDGGTPDDLKRHLLAIDLTDGSILWDRAVPAKLPEEERIRDHGFAANTPAVDDEQIYAFFGKSGVIAFDLNGKELWTADVGEKTNGWGTSSSPVLYQDLVIICASVESESLVALDRKTGKVRWSVGGIVEAWNTPLITKSGDGREELIVATHGKILAFSPTTGDSLWNCETGITWYMVPSLVAAGGVAYCLGGRSGITSLAVRLGGSGDVTATHRLWTSQKGSNVSSPVFHEGHLYWVNDQSGIAYCAKAQTGEIVYEKRMERAGQFYASSLLADGRLYYLARDGRTFVVAARPEFEELARNDLRDGGVFNGGPTVAGNRLLIRSDKFLYCVGK